MIWNTRSRLGPIKAQSKRPARPDFNCPFGGFFIWRIAMALTVNHPLLKEVRVYTTHIDTGSALSACVTAPIRGTITKLESIVHAVIGTANNVITPSINGTTITG